MYRFKSILFCIPLSLGCGVYIDPIFSTVVCEEDASTYHRPEGVAFTPSGDFIAVANSFSNTITFYRRAGADYETTVSFLIQGRQSLLNFPHDLSFSPDGKYLAVANRNGNSITIYKKHPLQEEFGSSPIAIIKGINSRPIVPDAVKYSPIENILAVTNRADNTIAFFEFSGDAYAKMPFQVIHGASLKLPNALSFSNDGKTLAVSYYDSQAIAIYRRLNELRYTSLPVQVLQGGKICYPHSLAFHPLENCLAVSCSQGRENVHMFSSDSEGFISQTPFLSLEISAMYDDSTLPSIDLLHKCGGVKGIAFSEQGDLFAVVQNLSRDKLNLSMHLGVMAIYRIN